MNDFRVMVMNPQFPKDRTKAKALSKEQFAVVHDYIIACLNDRKKPEDAQICSALECAGLPLFSAQAGSPAP